MAGSGVPKGYWGKQMREKPVNPPKVSARGPARENGRKEGGRRNG